MRILLIGNTGQLGWELERCLAPLGELQACDYPNIDLADVESIRHTFRECNPQLVVNAAAYTAVDRAESEPELAAAVNAVAPGALAQESRQAGAALVHYSTDYVFDGLKGSPYVETDPVHPLSVYGQTKLDGEKAIQQIGGSFLILRTSWVYSLRRDSFVSKVLGWSRARPTLKLVTDQISGPTWARMLAEATTQLVTLARDDLKGWFSEHQGVYHLAGAGYCSRFEWGQQVLQLDQHKEEQLARQLLPAVSTDFPAPARRPLFSALNCDLFNQTFHLKLPNWQVALKMAMETS